jgi:hypothetical protein
VLSIVIAGLMALILSGVLHVLSDEVGGLSGALVGLLVPVMLLVALLFWGRRRSNRSLGGQEGRQAFQSAIRTGVISPQADRERLTELVKQFYARRRPLLIVCGIVFGLFLLWSILVVDFPLDGRELRFLLEQLILMLLILVPGVLFIRRRNRQMAVLREALQIGDPPPR